MIVKRNRPKTQPARRIVRRATRSSVGAHTGGGRIVKRQRGMVTRRGDRTRVRMPNLGRFLFAGSVLLVAGVLAGTTWWAWQSPLFRVNSLNIEGNSTVTAESIALAAGLEDDSLFTIDLEGAEGRLAELPLLAGAEVKRDWPNGVSIVVDEREAWGTWVQGGVPYTVDRDGVVLGSVEITEGTPTIRTAETLTLRPGDHVDKQAVDAAAALYEQLPEALGTGIKEIAYLPGKGVQVETSEGLVGLLGDSSGISYKLAVWATVSEQAAREGINYSSIDLRYGNRPVLN